MRPRIVRSLKYLFVGTATIGTVGAVASLRSNNYELNAIGVVRLCRAATTVAGIGWTYHRELYQKQWDKKSELYKKVKSQCHKKAAEKLLDLCCTNRGVYIKVGQHIAALDYIVPDEYVETMRILHSNAPTNDIKDIYRVLKEDLKKDPNEIFHEFDAHPIGVASLAQVHKAYLLDGTPVAVKVQHPYVMGNSKVDVKTMEMLVKIVAWVFPDFKFSWLAEETKKNIFKELDFMQEGKNAEEVAAMFKDFVWLKVPKIHWNLTTNRVLTMDFVEGGQINDIDYIKRENIDPYDVSNKLGILYSRMIFMNGFVHSDPHPGNILVKKASDRTDCNVVLLDHGLYAKLTQQFRVEYAKLWLSILNIDRSAMRVHSSNLGIRGDLYGLFACIVTGRSWDSIMAGIDRTKPTNEEKELFQSQFSNLFTMISEVLESVDRQMLLILKTNDLMRGIEHTLKTQSRMKSFQVMSEACVNSVFREQLEHANTSFQRLRIRIIKYWTLLKISLFYFVRSLHVS